MQKYVYLFELDSVRKTDEEIVKGQKALYNEIVRNGNVVVLTYNQLIDSRGFFSLIDDFEYYKNLIALFESGAIRISQYGQVRTIVQYLINSMDEDKKFIYSALPLKFNQKRLTALVRRSLIYSDLSEIYSYIEGEKRSDDELKELFREVHGTITQDSSLTLEQMRKIIEKLYWLLSIVLRLSTIHQIYISPKNEKEYEKLKLHNILNIVVTFENLNDSLWNRAINVIKTLPCYRNHNNNRSVYHREIKEQYEKNGKAKTIEEYQYAEAIINLCYNYACEISICNISKHYNIDELKSEDSEKPTFRLDFFSRLNQDWNEGLNVASRYQTDETNEFNEFKKMEMIPDLEEAVRITQYSGVKNIENTDGIPRYEFEIDKQQREQKLCVMTAIFKRIPFLVLCIMIICSLEVVIQCLQGTFEKFMDTNNIVWSVIETFAVLLITEIITIFLSKKISGFCSLSDAIIGIGQLFGDAKHMFSKKLKTYVSDCSRDTDQKESYSIAVLIDNVKSKELNKYIEYKKDKKRSALFVKSREYPIADLEDNDVVKSLSGLEELYHYKFGVVYESRYNTVLVDPIESKDGSFFPYERVIPSSGNGVIMITKYKDKFILLKQFRHAIRTEQYSFPRGFAEVDFTPKENAIRELSEEISASITKEPVILGRIVPDSGMTSGKAYVYLVEIDSYNANIGHEGILDVMEVSEEELKELICKDKIDDGFTLGAYALYKCQILHSECQSLRDSVC